MSRLIIGVMSGTSADGVDAALVRVEGFGDATSAELIRLVSCDYPSELRQQIIQTRQTGRAELRTLAQIARTVGLAYATAVQQLLDEMRMRPDEICAIAAHGQTMFHDPPLTMQVIDPAILAFETGIDVISDFRRADCAAGGQGAPLVPFADRVMFRDEKRNRVILNIGGIANVTFLPRGDDPIIAFDTGPGNCVIDTLCQTLGQAFDIDGQLAARGRVDESIVRSALSHPYFAQRPPKSTDGPAMLSIVRSSNGFNSLDIVDQIATATQITIESIVQAIERFTPETIDEVVLAGGGAKNRTLLNGLRSRLAVALVLSDDLGIPTQAREAMAFAILGAATLDRVPGNVLSVTGASRPVVLGAITPRTS